jgi:hypothetical protein
MWKIEMAEDMKYLILSLAIVSLVLVTQAQESRRKVLSSQNGRFVFGQTSDARFDHYMLDTQTGRLWHLCYGPDSVLVLEPIIYLADEAGQYPLVPKAK